MHGSCALLNRATLATKPNPTRSSLVCKVARDVSSKYQHIAFNKSYKELINKALSTSAHATGHTKPMADQVLILLTFVSSNEGSQVRLFQDVAKHIMLAAVTHERPHALHSIHVHASGGWGSNLCYGPAIGPEPGADMLPSPSCVAAFEPQVPVYTNLFDIQGRAREGM